MRLLALLISLVNVLPADVQATDPVQILYLSETGIVVVNVTIQSGSSSLDAQFDAAVDHLQRQLDANRDGVVTVEEARGKVLTAEEARELQLTGERNVAAGDPDHAPKDGRITTPELRAWLRRIGVQPLTVLIAPAALPDGPGSSEAQAPLFERLDSNQDGQLSPAELAAAQGTLQKLDRDDDESISIAELRPRITPSFLSPSDPGQRPPLPFASPAAGDSVVQQVRRILQKYDVAPRDQKLSPTEIQIGESDFERLDLDRDGHLDSAEMRQLLAGLPPSLELSVDPKTATFESAGERAAATKASATGTISLAVGKTQIRFDLRPTVPINLKAAARTLVQGLDRNADGYLEAAEVSNRGMRGFSFADLDTDQNNKVFPDEVEAALEFRQGLIQCCTILEVSEQGGTLFAILDADRDGRLSPRELRQLGDSLTLWDSDGNGHLSRAEIPLQYSVAIAQGSVASLLAGSGAAMGSSPGADPRRGPLWFLRMDRNRDGEVSRREFLADQAFFDRLDVNRDDTIDSNEALKAPPR